MLKAIAVFAVLGFVVFVNLGIIGLLSPSSLKLKSKSQSKKFFVLTFICLVTAVVTFLTIRSQKETSKNEVEKMVEEAKQQMEEAQKKQLAVLTSVQTHDSEPTIE
jgi:mannitol-specific phosphotransferase system IIBC component